VGEGKGKEIFWGKVKPRGGGRAFEKRAVPPTDTLGSGEPKPFAGISLHDRIAP